MQLPLLVIAVGLVATGVCSSNNKFNNIINKRDDQGDEISKRETALHGEVNSIDAILDSKVKDLLLSGSNYNISQINRVTKSFSNSKQADVGVETSKEIELRQNNTHVQVHMEETGNRLVKRKSSVGSAPPVQTDATNGYFLPPNNQNIYNGNQYNSNFNYRMSNQQTYGGHTQAFNRLGKYFTNAYGRINNNFNRNNNGNVNRDPVGKPVEAFNLSEGRVKNVENMNGKINNRQNDPPNENRDKNPFKEYPKTSVQNSSYHNPFSASKKINDQVSNILNNNEDTNKYSKVETITSTSVGPERKFSTTITPGVQSTQFNSEEYEPPSVVGFTNYQQRYENKKPSNGFGAKIKTATENISKSLNDVEQFIINFNRNENFNNTTSNVSIQGNSEKYSKRNSGLNFATSNSVPTVKYTGQVYQQGTVPTIRTNNRITDNPIDFQNHSTRNFVPFYDFRAYNSADTKPYQPHKIDQNNNVLLRKTTNEIVNNVPVNYLTPPINSDYYGAARSFNNVDTTTTYSTPKNNIPENDKNKIVSGNNGSNQTPTNYVSQRTHNNIEGQILKQNDNFTRNFNHNSSPNFKQNDINAAHSNQNSAPNFKQNEINAVNLNTNISRSFIQAPNFSQNNSPNFKPLDINVPNINQPTSIKQNVINIQNDNQQNNLNQNSAANFKQNEINTQHYNHNEQTYKQNNINANAYQNHAQAFKQSDPSPIFNSNNLNTPNFNPSNNIAQNFNQFSQFFPPNEPSNNQRSSTIPFLDTNSVLVQNNGAPTSENYTLDTSSDYVVLNRSSRFLLNRPLPPTYYSLPKSPILPTFPGPPLLPGPLSPTAYTFPSYTPATPTLPTLPPTLSYSPVATKSASGYDGFYGQAKPITLNSLVPFDVQVKDVMCYRSGSSSKFSTSFVTSQFLLHSPIIEDTARGVSCDVTQVDSFRYQIDFNSDDVMTACGIRNCGPPEAATDFLLHSPIIEDTARGVSCDVTQVDSFRYQIDFNSDDVMTACGIRNCGPPEAATDLLCVTIRFPVTRGLRQLTDTTVTIQCKPLPASQSQTKQISLKPVQRAKEARNLGALLSDAKPVEMHSDLTLYRKGGAGQFSRQISPGSSVELGEELQLKCSVRHGDGWVYSRMSDVKVHKSSQERTPTDEDTVVVVNDNGCTNPDMKTICPHEQYRDIADPLSSALTLRTFMFQGMKDGDEMVISAKITACVDPRDCAVDPSCLPGNAGWFPYARKRRSAPHLGQDLMEDQETSVAFKIRLKTGAPCDNCVVLQSARTSQSALLIPIFVMTTVLILSTAFIYLLVQMYKQERNYIEVWN